jgi:tRNA dimethylallyltransferase
MPEMCADSSFHGIILTGPTASGKSAAALHLAHRMDGEIVNADSMQVYSHLPLLTAHPSSQDLKDIPHHLYGILHGQERGSVGWWYPQACAQINDILSRKRVPIIVGGTGMYLMALLEGLAKIPTIPDDVRSKVRLWAQEEDFYERVKSVDPESAQTLNPQDKQRLARALEVILATGKSLRSWQQQTEKLEHYHFLVLALVPDRPTLYHRINTRFAHMIEQGALEEVQQFMALSISPDNPITKAVGLPELQAYLSHQMDLNSAIEKAQQSTRQYAKRQMTWIRGQLSQAKQISEWDHEMEAQVIKDFFANKSIS